MVRFFTMRRGHSAVLGARGVSTLAAFVVGGLLWMGAGVSQAALTRHWDLDDGAPSQTAADSASTFDATLGGTLAVQTTDPTWVSGKVGSNALSFDGGDYALVGANPSFTTGNQISISAWVKRGRAGVREMYTAEGNGGSTATTTFWVEFTAGDNLGFWLGEDTGPSGSTLVGPTDITDTDWHHIVASWDGTTKRIWLDGDLEASTAFAGTEINESGQAFAIGRLGAGGFHFLGQVDDFGIWTEALSEDKIEAIINLANEASLNYDQGEAEQLFDAFDAEAFSVVVDGTFWYGIFDGSLGGTAGDLLDLGGGDFALNLGDGNGLTTIAPPPIPEPSSLVLLALGVVGLFRRRARTLLWRSQYSSSARCRSR